jgi:hypothetical protein
MGPTFTKGPYLSTDGSTMPPTLRCAHLALLKPSTPIRMYKSRVLLIANLSSTLRIECSHSRSTEKMHVQSLDCQFPWAGLLIIRDIKRHFSFQKHRTAYIYKIFLLSWLFLFCTSTHHQVHSLFNSVRSVSQCLDANLVKAHLLIE